MQSKNKLIIFCLVPFFLLITHYLAVFPHEFAHSFMAWMLGYKSNPLHINFGGTSWKNILLLSNIDENINYSLIFSSGHSIDVALIAFAGPGIANGGLFFLSYSLLKSNAIRANNYLYLFVFLFNLMNLGNLYDYVPIRAFAPIDDVHNFVSGLHISPWVSYIAFGYIVAFLVCQFFAKTLTHTYKNMRLKSTAEKSALMILCVLILFGFFGGFPYVYFLGKNLVGDITYFLSATSFAAIPGIIVLLWPKSYDD